MANGHGDVFQVVKHLSSGSLCLVVLSRSFSHPETFATGRWLWGLFPFYPEYSGVADFRIGGLYISLTASQGGGGEVHVATSGSAGVSGVYAKGGHPTGGVVTKLEVNFEGFWPKINPSVYPPWAWENQ